MRPEWRPMTLADLPPVLALAGRLHPHHPESAEVFAERLVLAPAGCRVLASDGGLLGYAITHPWTGDGPPALDTLLGALPERPGAWHVHDVALDPAARGGGYAAAILGAIVAASPYPLVTLVAIAGSGDYWARQGFRGAAAGDPGAVASYGAGARFMTRPR